MAWLAWIICGILALGGVACFWLRAENSAVKDAAIEGHKARANLAEAKVLELEAVIKSLRKIEKEKHVQEASRIKSISDFAKLVNAKLREGASGTGPGS